MSALFVNQLVNDFLLDLQVNLNRSPATIKAYDSDMSLFCRYLACRTHELPLSQFDSVNTDQLTISDIDAVTISLMDDYSRFLLKDRQISNNIVRRRQKLIIAFFDYLKKCFLIDINPLSDFKVRSVIKAKERRFLSLAQINTLLRSIDGQNKERDYAIIILFLSTGLKLGEVAGLKLSDDHGLFLVLKDRTIPIIDICRSALDQYLAVREPGHSAFFLSVNHSPLTIRGIQNLLVKHFTAAGIEEASASTLRQTAAKLLAQQNGDVSTVRKILGYQPSSSLEFFTDMDDTDPDSLLSAVHGHPLAFKS